MWGLWGQRSKSSRWDQKTDGRLYPDCNCHQWPVLQLLPKPYQNGKRPRKRNQKPRPPRSLTECHKKTRLYGLSVPLSTNHRLPPKNPFRFVSLLSLDLPLGEVKGLPLTSWKAPSRKKGLRQQRGLRLTAERTLASYRLS